MEKIIIRICFVCLLMIVVTPFLPLLTSFGLYLMWQLIKYAPLYLFTTQRIWKIEQANRHSNNLRNKLLKSIAKLPAILIIQLIYWFIILPYIITPNLLKIDILLLEGLKSSSWITIINSPELIIDLIKLWLQVQEFTEDTIAFMTTIIASFALLLMSIPLICGTRLLFNESDTGVIE